MPRSLTSVTFGNIVVLLLRMLSFDCKNFQNRFFVIFLNMLLVLYCFPNMANEKVKVKVKERIVLLEIHLRTRTKIG